MTTALILLGVGLLLIFLEFFLPGGIMGIAGGVLVIISIVVFSVQSESAWAVVAYVVGTIVLLGLLVRFALWRVKHGKGSGSLYLRDDQEGYTASTFDRALIGREGEALSDLKPAGHILIDRKRLQAVSKTGYILKGTAIIVVGGEGGHLIVKKRET